MNTGYRADPIAFARQMETFDRMREIEAASRRDAKRVERPDFSVSHHGSVAILHALTPAAKEWVDEHLPADAMTWGTCGTVVEPRYVEEIVDGIPGDGLMVRS